MAAPVAVVVVVVALFVVVSGSSTTTRDLGQTARTASFDITAFAVNDPQAPGQTTRPRTGMHYVSVDVEVANRAATARTFSSIVGFHLVDQAGRRYDETITDIVPHSPEGQLRPGQTARGLAVFEVPDGARPRTFLAQGNLTTSPVRFRLA